MRALARADRAAVQAFHGGVVPVLSGRDPAGMERAIKGEMEEGESCSGSCSDSGGLDEAR